MSWNKVPYVECMNECMSVGCCCGFEGVLTTRLYPHCLISLTADTMVSTKLFAEQRPADVVSPPTPVGTLQLPVPSARPSSPDMHLHIRKRNDAKYRG